MARCRADTTPRDLALVVTSGVALDLVVVLALARLVRLEWAIWIARGFECAVVAALLVRARPRRPAWVDSRALGAVAACALVAAVASYLLSRPYAIWDRAWHELLASSLRAQRIPFTNVYDPHGTLPYHFTGDVLAATLQTLSFSRMHVARALSLEHDVMFALTGAVMALLLIDRGIRNAAVCVAATVALLLTGPVTVVHGGAATPVSGFTIFNYWTLSYRPHTCLAGLLLLGVLAAVMPRDPQLGSRHTLPALVLLAFVLGITDEVSIAMTIAALGLTWLVAPAAIDPKRVRGALALAAMAAAVFASNVIFAGSLAHGAPRAPMRWIPFRVPLVAPVDPALAPLHPLLLDFLPTLLLVIAVAIVLWRQRAALAPLVMLGTLLSIGVLVQTHIDINAMATESHRFVTPALFLAPAIAAVTLASERRRLPTVVASCGALLAVVSTAQWYVAAAPKHCERHDDEKFSGAGDLYAADCRRDVGSTLGAALGPTYVEAPILYLYAGCVPTFQAADQPYYWSIQTSAPRSGKAALSEFDERQVPHDEPLAAICLDQRSTRADLVCDYARDHGLCGPTIGVTRRCSVSPSARRALLAPTRIE